MESEPPFQQICKTLFRDFIQEPKTGKDQEREVYSSVSHELPLIDLSRLGVGGLDRKLCEREIAEAASEWGFFQVVNHGISPDLLERMKREQVKLFRQPFYKKVNEKLLNLSTGCYRWGNPTATSLGQFSWSEAFHIPLSNISAITDFDIARSPIEEFAEMVSDLAQTIAGILAENLCCKSTLFSENCLPSSCYLRMNRYPPCPIFSKAYGLMPHTDSDFLTILYQDQLGGLQLVKDGKWVGVKPNPDAFIINIGDLFQAWSNDVYKSIEHRVVTNRKFERFSVAYFLCPSDDTVIQSCIEPSIYRKFNFRDFRQQVREDVKSTGRKIGLPRFLR